MTKTKQSPAELNDKDRKIMDFIIKTFPKNALVILSTYINFHLKGNDQLLHEFILHFKPKGEVCGLQKNPIVDSVQSDNCPVTSESGFKDVLIYWQLLTLLYKTPITFKVLSNIAKEAAAEYDKEEKLFVVDFDSMNVLFEVKVGPKTETVALFRDGFREVLTDTAAQTLMDKSKYPLICTQDDYYGTRNTIDNMPELTD